MFFFLCNRGDSIRFSKISVKFDPHVHINRYCSSRWDTDFNPCDGLVDQVLQVNTARVFLFTYSLVSRLVVRKTEDLKL